MYTEELTWKRPGVDIVKDIQAGLWLQSLQFSKRDREFNTTSYSYVAELREINIAVKVKENQYKAREKEQSVHS